MHLLWIAPAAVAVAGVVAVIGAAGRVADEARGLIRTLGRTAELRPALVELRDAGRDLQRSTTALRQRP